jgi:hypothetical protein
MPTAISAASFAARAALAGLLVAFPLTALSDASGLLDGSMDMGSSRVRASTARALAHDVAGALARLGAPSAAEQARVAAEMHAIEDLQDPAAVNARGHQLYSSAAFQHLRLYNTLSAARDALTCAAAEASLRQRQREMACWAMAGTYLADRERSGTALGVLWKAGALTHAGGMSAQRWNAEAQRWARYGRAIQERIAIPYLAGTLE